MNIKPDYSNPFAVTDFIEKHTKECKVQREDGSIEAIRVMDFDTENILIVPAEPESIKQAATPWECPVCGCGVRGDVEVCPNCVKRDGGKRAIIKEQWDGYSKLFDELEDGQTVIRHPKGQGL